MSIDPELQKIIDDFAEAMNEKDKELTAFNNAIDVILDGAKKRMEEKVVELEASFQAEAISEETYLEAIKETKAVIIRETEQALQELVDGLKN